MSSSTITLQFKSADDAKKVFLKLKARASIEVIDTHESSTFTAADADDERQIITYNEVELRPIYLRL